MAIFRCWLLLILFAGISSSGWGQVAFWQKYMGGSGYDRGKSLMVLDDETLIIAGNVLSADKLGENNHSDNSDFFIGRYATQGQFFWQRTYGGTGWDEVAEVIQTKDKGFICIGTSDSNDGDVGLNYGSRDIWVLKLNRSGQIEWTKAFGGKGDDQGLTVIETSGGDFLLGGESGSAASGTMRSLQHGGLDSWMAKLGPNGRLIWERHFGGAGNEKISRIHEMPDDKFLIINSSDSRDQDVTQNLGKKDCWIFLLNEAGEIEWQTNYGGEENDDIHSSIMDHEGNIIIAGTTFSGGGHIPVQRGLGDFWVFKISPQGLLFWSKTFGGRREEGANDVIQTSDSNYVVCGITKSRTGEGDIKFNNGYYDGWLLKLDQQGNRLWSRTHGFTGADGMEEVCELKDGGFLTMGYSQLPAGFRGMPGHNGSSDFWIANFGDPGKSATRPFVTPPLLIGTIKDKDSGKFLEAKIILTDNKSLDSLNSATSDPENGSFGLALPAYGLASINVLTPGYLFYGQDIWLDTLNSETSIEMTIELEAIRIGSSLILKNIYFNAGKWDLLQPSYAELERVVAFMELNPRVVILVSGHTDNTGNRTQKVELSLNRAKQVKSYLVKQGIMPARLKVKGYGMYRPIATNKTAEGRRKNRRVEFEVINK